MLSLAFPPRQLASGLRAIQAAAAASGVTVSISGSAGAGVLDVNVAAQWPATAVAAFAASLPAALAGLDAAGPATTVPSAVLIYAPDEVRDLAARHGTAVSLGVASSVKDEFDPERRMAPGRLAEQAA